MVTVQSSPSYPEKGAVRVGDDRQKRLVDWPAILAGGVIAAGISFLLLSFGGALGLSLASPFSSSAPAGSTIAMLAVFWFAFAQIYSFGVGGYVAGRLRGPANDGANREETEFRDGIAGLIVWASALLISAMLVANTAAGVAQVAGEGVSRAAGSAASAAASGITSSLPSTLPNADYLTDVFVRATEPGSSDGAGTTLSANPGAKPGPGAAAQPVNPPTTAPAAGGTAQPGSANQNATNFASVNQADTRNEMGRILTVGAVRGQLSADDKQRLASIVASRSSISQDEAAKRIDTAVAKMMAARDELVQQAKVAADNARSVAAKTAFWVAVTMLLTGIGAWYGALMGGRHRDENRYTWN